jgi:hypothetical protein
VEKLLTTGLAEQKAKDKISVKKISKFFSKLLLKKFFKIFLWNLFSIGRISININKSFEKYILPTLEYPLKVSALIQFAHTDSITPTVDVTS